MYLSSTNKYGEIMRQIGEIRREINAPAANLPELECALQLIRTQLATVTDEDQDLLAEVEGAMDKINAIKTHKLKVSIHKLAKEGSFMETFPLLYSLGPDSRLDAICDMRQQHPSFITSEEMMDVVELILEDAARQLNQFFTDSLRFQKVSAADRPYAGRFPTTEEFEADPEMAALIREGWIPFGESFNTFGESTVDAIQNASHLGRLKNAGFEATCSSKAYKFGNPVTNQQIAEYVQIFIRPKADHETLPAFLQYYKTVKDLINYIEKPH